MQILAQKFKITVVSILFLTVFGVSLNILSYYTSYGNFNVMIIMVLLLISFEIVVFYRWLNRLHRVLMVIKYREEKENEE